MAPAKLSLNFSNGFNLCTEPSVSEPDSRLSGFFYIVVYFFSIQEKITRPVAFTATRLCPCATAGLAYKKLLTNNTIFSKFSYLSKTESETYEKLFGHHIRERNRKVPPQDELRYNASMLLSNSHVSTGLPDTLPQNVISIAGFHINVNIEPLPDVSCFVFLFIHPYFTLRPLLCSGSV